VRKVGHETLSTANDGGVWHVVVRKTK